MNVTNHFMASHGVATFNVTRVGLEAADLFHPLSVTSQTAWLQIETRPINRAPQISAHNSQTLSVEHTSASAAPSTTTTLAAYDADSDEVMFSLSKYPSHGSVHLALSSSELAAAAVDASTRVGPVIREHGRLLFQWPKFRKFIQGSDAGSRPPSLDFFKFDLSDFEDRDEAKQGELGLKVVEVLKSNSGFRFVPIRIFIFKHHNL